MRDNCNKARSGGGDEFRQYFNQIKILGITGILCVLLVITGLFALRGQKTLQHETATIENLFELDVTFLKREIDHFSWIGQVSNFILDHSLKSLTAEKSKRWCRFLSTAIFAP